MNIHDSAGKIKQNLQIQVLERYFRVIFIIFLAFILGGLWQIRAIKTTHKPITIDYIEQSKDERAQTEKVYGSKTGHSYYFSFCGALKHTKPKNRVEFATAAVARTKGYVAAKNCKGVQ